MTVFLVGAGPGDPGLITVRGLELIKRADVILYDRLANPQLLEHAKGSCIKVFVGKEPHCHAHSQHEINALLTRYGREHRCVVRLKGGDPFVFGRGGEEMDALIEGGIPFEIVPGISSALAAPAYEGIPLTRRGHNASVTFITGHRWDSSRIKDTYPLLSGTLVILMGARSFPSIARDLMELGYGPDSFVSAIHNATTHSQNALNGTLGEMASRKIPSPSVIIVDGAGSTSGRERWFRNKLLGIRGKRVAVMRTQEQFEETRALLEGVGAEAVNGGTYRLSSITWDRQALERATHVVVTSANTVPRVREEIIANSDKAYVAIGPATRRALEAIGISAEMPDEYTSEGLGMLLKSITAHGDAIVGLRSSMASDILSSMLSHLHYTEIPVYDVGIGEINEQGISDADVIFFTSSAMVNAISHLVRDGHICISIGPQTSSALRSRGVTVDMESSSSTVPSMIAAAMDVIYSRTGGG